MQRRRKCHFGNVLYASILALGLSACGGALCPNRTEFQNAVHYTHYSVPDGRYPYREPQNAWTDRPKLAAFLRKAVAADGAQGLVSKYGFQCVSRPADAACSDCFTCTVAVPENYDDMWALRSLCVDDGDIFVRAEIGPGSAASAMTYWRPVRVWGK